MTSDVRDRLGLEHPVLQAALGGGLARAELASAVSRAGGLGTVGIVADPAAYRAQLQRAKEQAPGKPIAANLLMPFARRGHVQACIAERVPVVSLFFGFDRRVVEALHDAGAVVLHQVGTVAQAKRALADGADGLIAQSLGAGGHLLGEGPLDALLPQLAELAPDRPLFAAGGICDRATASAALALGASGVAAGTRFLLTPESHAHPGYKERLLRADRTLVTLLFGLGWHALHRVVPNAATDRWCARDPLGPSWVRALNATTQPLLQRLPASAQRGTIGAQRVERPFYTPSSVLRGMDERLLDVAPLYAGECVTQITALRPAAEVVAELAVVVA
jgi:nitronate monooxygenase